MTEHTPPETDDNKLIKERRAKLTTLRELGIAFPNDFRRSVSARELQTRFAKTTREELESDMRNFSVAGRLTRNRGAFLVIQDGSDNMQLYIDRKCLSEEVRRHIKLWDLGDIIGASGVLCRSGKGDLYISMAKARLLTKALRPPPDKYSGLADRELRYRQRYLDLIANPEVRRAFEIRSEALRFIRSFFEREGFMEVETPMLHPIPGGATARPFKTHHNALNLQMYLRVAPELYLKRLTIGGFEKVFEVNRNFRNEGLSTRHNPEFTMLEYYWAYADYLDAMDLTERLLRELAEEVLGTSILKVGEESLDLSEPFVRMTMLEAILHYNRDLSAQQISEITSVRVIASSLGIECEPSWGLGRVQMEIFELTVEGKLTKPTFITAYPTEVSPLARQNDRDSFVADRFELFVAGREIANGFSELNDSEDQANRFRAQVAEKDAGDDEAMHYDQDYVRALEYGLPPTAGEGIGIDRLVMLLTNAASIRDVILFPHMRPE